MTDRLAAAFPPSLPSRGRDWLRRSVFCWILLLVLAQPGTVSAQITPIRVGETLTGELSASASIITYAFDGTAGDTLMAQVVSARGDLHPRLILLGPGFTALALSSDPAWGQESAREARLSFPLPSTTRYSLAVTSARGARAAFTVSLYRALSTATPGSLPSAAATTALAVQPTGTATVEFLFPLLQTATAWAAGTVPAIPTVNPAALTNAAMMENVGSSILTAQAETPSPTPYCPPNSLFGCAFPTLTPVPVPTVWPPLNGTFEVAVSSVEPTQLSQTLNGPGQHQIRLQFVNLSGLVQPQRFRIAVDCTANEIGLLQWDGGTCGDSYTETIEAGSAGQLPWRDLALQILVLDPPTQVPYQLTITPETDFAGVAPPDTDHLLNVPLTSVTTFSQAISAPQGDSADKITVRIPDLFTGSWDFTFGLLCSGVGVDAVAWSLQTGSVLACGDTIMLPLAPAPNVSPVASLDMFMALPGQSPPAHVQYTLIITPAGASAGSGSFAFDVALDGESAFVQTVPANGIQTVQVRAPAVSPSLPRAIAFTLACAGGDVLVTVPGVAGPFGCGGSLQRTFADPTEVVPFTIQASGELVAYTLRAAPVYANAAPADANPHVLALRPLEAATLAEVVSAPEGDRTDQIVLDASTLRPNELPRTFTITLACEGPTNASLSGQTATGLSFACGSSFDYTFGPGDTDREAQVLPTRSTLPGLTTPGDSPLSLTLTIALPDDAPAGLVSYMLRAVPTGIDQSAPQETMLNDYVIEVSSTAMTTFNQTLTAYQRDRLRVRFPDLEGAHRQAFNLTLLCSGVGTAAVQWTSDSGQVLGCGSTLYGEFQASSGGSTPGTDSILEFGPTDTLAQVSYTLQIEPASAYAPIAADDSDSEPYQLAVSILDQTSFTEELSAPQGDQIDIIQAMIPDMIGGQAAGRDFTFWLTCDGANAGSTRYEIVLPGSVPFIGLCGVPLTLYLDESIGSPPRFDIRVLLPDTNQPTFSRYMLVITPAGAELPFTLPTTPTPTPFLFQMITLAPTAMPTLIQTATLSPTPIPVRASATFNLTLATQTPTVTTTPIPPINALPGGDIGNPGAQCASGTCTPTPTPLPPPPVLLAPANGAFIAAPPAILTWSAVSGAQSYTLRITSCAVEIGECTGPNELEMTGTSYPLYWGDYQVASVNGSLEITWSARANFGSATTGYAESHAFQIAQAPNALGPLITAPASFSVQSPPVVTVRWEPVPGATGYEIGTEWCPQPVIGNCVTAPRQTVSGGTTSLGIACDPERPYLSSHVSALFTLTNTRTRFLANPVQHALCADPTPTPFFIQAITLAPSATPTPLLLQMITLAPSATSTASPTATPFFIQAITLGPSTTPTVTFSPTATATFSLTPIPVRASATLALLPTTSTPTPTVTPIPMVTLGSVPGGEFGNPGALCASGTCTPTPTPIPTPVLLSAASLLSPANGEVVSAQPATLSWPAVSGATYYLVMLGTCFEGTTECSHSQVDGSWMIMTTSTNRSVYWGEMRGMRWQVAAFFDAYTTIANATARLSAAPAPATTTARTFQAFAAPQVAGPAITAPSYNSTISAAAFTLQWSMLVGAASYDVNYLFCNDAGADCIVVEASRLQGTSHTQECQPGRPRVSASVRGYYQETYSLSAFSAVLPFRCGPPTPTPELTPTPPAPTATDRGPTPIPTRGRRP